MLILLSRYRRRQEGDRLVPVLSVESRVPRASLPARALVDRAMSSAPASEADVQRLLAHVTEVRRLASRAVVPSRLAADRNQLTRAFSISSQAVRRERELEAQLQEYDAQYDELQRLVRSLPEKPRHAVMIPCTKFALFEGELCGDEDLLVGVGCDYLVERDARGACEIIERRRDIIRAKIRDADHNARAMESRLYAVGALRDVGGVGGGGGLLTVPEEETLVEDGRARIAHMDDGTVEITEVYEAGDAEIASISTMGPSSGNDPVDGAEARGDLDDFISRLEAMEMNESGVASTSEALMDDCCDDDDDDDSDVDIDGGKPPTIECPEDFPKYERWKAKRAAKDAELRAQAERVRIRAEEEKLRMEEEIRRRHPAVKQTVIERRPGEEASSSSSRNEGNIDLNRKLSRYQMKKLGLQGLDPDAA